MQWDVSEVNVALSIKAKFILNPVLNVALTIKAHFILNNAPK